MGFDIGAGLSSAGTAVAATAGAMTLESQKAELEMEKVKLADQLAGAREEKQRGFLTSERVATQEFTGGENTKNRQNSVDIANISAKASVQAAGIGAGATIASANIHATMMQKQMDQNAPLIAQQIEASKASTEQEKAKTAFQIIANNNATEGEKAQKEYADATASGDPDRIAKAGQALAVAKFSMGEAQTKAAADATLAKLAKDELDKVQTQVSLPINQSSPERIAQLQGQLKTAQDLYNSRMAAAIESAKAVPRLPVGSSEAPGVIKYDAQGNRVTGQATPTSLPVPQAPSSGATGLINGGPM